jgi:septal ring factor EnvC (AmiA/AmiB activator)
MLSYLNLKKLKKKMGIESFDWRDIILAVIGCISLWVGGIFFYPQNKKAKNLENETKQSDEWKRLYQEACEENIRKEKKIEELYKEIAKQRDEKAELHKQSSSLSAENASLSTSLKYLKCEMPGCPHRTPPTGY